MTGDHPIFLESMSFIKSKIVNNNLNYYETKILERLIHTSGDFQIQGLLEFSEDVCENAIKAIKVGAPILTDTDMAAAAIRSMAQQTNGNNIYSAKRWIDNNLEIPTTKTASDFFCTRRCTESN